MSDNNKQLTPEIYRDICYSPEKSKKFHNSIEGMTALCHRLRFCESCKKLNNSNKYVKCSNGCYLEILGVISDFSNDDMVSFSELISSISFFFLRFTDLYIKYLEDKGNIEKQLEIIDNDFQYLTEEKNKLAAETAAFNEKKEKLGRPTDFDNRRFKYEVYWVQANPKPTLRELGKKFNPPISASQVRRDLVKLGYVEDTKSKDKKSKKSKK